MTKSNPHEKAIRTAVQQQIDAETAIRRTFYSELARAKQVTNPPAAKKPKPKPARELTDLEKMGRLARASGWKPAREKQTEPGVLDFWHRFGGSR